MSNPAPPPEPTPFEKMAALAAKVISVPKSEVDRLEKTERTAKSQRKMRGSG